MPYATAIAEFREQVRQEARTLKATNILKYCDDLRDDILPSLGVRLEDREGSGVPFAVKLVDKETLLKERAQKQKVGTFDLMHELLLFVGKVREIPLTVISHVLCFSAA